MKLEGMKINFLGDSITEGCCTSGPEYAFHQIIKRDYNLEIANNYGVGGTRIARQTMPSRENTRWDYTFEIRAEVMERDVDAVVVFGGTNDYGHGDAEFGKTDDGDNIYTFCGAVNSLITKLKNDFPKSEIIFMTPIHRLNETNPSAPDNKNLADYSDAIIEICKLRDVKIIDLFAINPLDPADAALVPDGLHPNDDGHKVMAEVIAHELMKI